MTDQIKLLENHSIKHLGLNQLMIYEEVYTYRRISKQCFAQTTQELGIWSTMASKAFPFFSIFSAILLSLLSHNYSVLAHSNGKKKNHPHLSPLSTWKVAKKATRLKASTSSKNTRKSLATWTMKILRFKALTLTPIFWWALGIYHQNLPAQF